MYRAPSSTARRVTATAFAVSPAGPLHRPGSCIAPKPSRGTVTVPPSSKTPGPEALSVLLAVVLVGDVGPESGAGSADEEVMGGSIAPVGPDCHIHFLRSSS